MNGEEIACRELVEMVTDYLEDALTPADRARFDQHLDECGGCRAYLDQMRRTIAVTGRLSSEAISADSRERLLSAFREWTSSGITA